MHSIVMEITLLIMENHGKSWNCVLNFCGKPDITPEYFYRTNNNIYFDLDLKGEERSGSVMFAILAANFLKQMPFVVNGGKCMKSKSNLKLHSL